MSDFIVEVAVRVKVEADAFPDEVAVSIIDKIKTKILCNRESMSLVGLKQDIFELEDEDEDD